MSFASVRSLLLCALVLSPVWAATRADAQSYTVTTGTTTYTPAHSLSGATVHYASATSGSTTTAKTFTVSLPFEFSFYGEAQSSMTISSFGYITFGGTGTLASNTTLPNTAQPNGLIAPMWDSLTLQRYTGTMDPNYADPRIASATTGTAPNRVFHVSWHRMATSTGPYNNASAMVQLYEGSNRIRFIYGPGYNWGTTYGTFSWTMGIENTAGTVANLAASCSPSCLLTSITDGRYYDFTPTEDVGVSAVSAPASAAAGDMVTVNRTFRNNGSTASTARTYGIFLSTDATITAADTRVFSGSLAALAPTTEHTTADTFLLDFDGPAGSYYVGVLLEGSDSNAANNAAAAVSPTSITVPLAITAPATLPDAVLGLPIPFSPNPYTFKAVGPGTTRSWSLTSGSLPAGITLNAATGQLEGTPTAATSAGGQAFMVSVNNGTDTASRAYTLVVRPRLTITTTTLPQAAQDVAYSTQLEAVGGPDGRTWSVLNGALPAGITLAANGVLSGTPTSTGSFPLTVRVAAGTSPLQQSAEASLTLVVQARLSVTLPGGATNPPDAITNEDYALQPTLAGGTNSYVVSISSGTLPTGLSLNATTGAITGRVPSTGTWGFTYRVKSGEQTVDSAWTINAYGKLAISDTSLPAAIEGAAYAYTLTATGGAATKTWSQNGSLPTGIALSSAGVFSGTPAAPSGTNPRSLTYTVVSGSQSATRTLDLLVIGRLLLPATTPPVAVRTTAYSFTPPVSGGLAQKSFRIAAGALPAGLALDASTGAITGVPTQAGTFSATIEVTSGAGPTAQTATQSYSFAVYDPLVITTASLPDGRVGQSYGPELLAFTGGAGAWSWSATGLPAGLTLNAQSGEVSGTPTTYTAATVVVTLLRGTQTTQKTYTFVVYGQLVITSPAVPEAGRGVAYQYDLVASGAPTVAWSLDSGTLPAGLSMSAQGRISGTPGAVATAATFVVKATANNQVATKSFTLEVFDPVVVTTSTLPTAVVGRSYDALLAASGGRNATYTWTASSLPAGLFANVSTGRITGIPTADGSYSALVEAKSGALSGSRTVSMRVDPLLLITTTALGDAVRGTAYSTTLQATGGAGTITWTGLSLPPGFSLSPTGVLSGTASSLGSFTVQVRVTSGGQTDEKSFTLPVYDPLQMTTTALPEAVRGTSYSSTLVASGGAGASAHRWSILNGTLPPGLSLGTNGSIGGVPTLTGTFSVDVQVTSGTQTVTRTLSIDVRERLELATIALPDGKVGTAYFASLAATGGTGTYEWTAQSLPPGLQVSTSGTVSGTPTSAGTFSVFVRLKSGGQTVERSLTLGVYAPLVVTTTTLVEAVRGRSYGQLLQASGGASTQSWLAVGPLPAGLSLSSSGTLGGVPTQAGRFTFDVRVTSRDQIATKQLALDVREPLAITTTALPDATTNAAYSTQLAASGGDGTVRWSVDALPPGLQLDAQTGRLHGTPSAEGSHWFDVTATSGAQTSRRSFSLGVYSALTLTTLSLPEATRSRPYSARIEAAGGSTTKRWSVSEGQLPPGLTLSSLTGEISGTPFSTGEQTFTVRIASGGQEVSGTLTIVVREPLGIENTSLPAAQVKVAFEHAFRAVGGNDAERRWSVRSGRVPPGLTLGEAGQLAGTPVLEGEFAFDVQVDSADQSATARITMTVQPGVLPLFVTTRRLTPALVGTPYSVRLEADGGTPPYAWTGTSLPEGFTLASDGTLQGIGTRESSHSLSITLTDSANGTATAQLDLLVASPETVTVLEAPLRGALVGVSYAERLFAMGGTPPYTWNLAGGALPEGITVTGDGRLSGVTQVEPGVFEFTARAVDRNEKEGSATFVLGVGRDGEVTLYPLALPSGTVDARYHAELFAVGGGEPYVFSSAEGLPPGIVVDRTGALVGTPREMGEFLFRLRVDDATGLSSTRDLRIVVEDSERREDRGAGCGCASPASSAGALLLLGVLGLRRRTRSAR